MEKPDITEVVRENYAQAGLQRGCEHAAARVPRLHVSVRLHPISYDRTQMDALPEASLVRILGCR